ncbi:hypothetical protein C7U92_20985 [Bradyrhizobium sp. WBOS7]|uniref:Uncharacterized protein n=1 Tax=Bradyrhizobium betae TaxID=244734 RepID=A0AAE9N411_9BRAD|nr:hypothetical protein [Bradyrhizobium sp. WBOS2]MDD1579172.1 hypothetical protein [Bradyrhizobium sp. WBOS7]MDD1601979.1 hypothetical protein [Bradyrhizobium sp. WBOS16]UUO33275.1 hypothetical protein DCK84_00880 [Bradyrhizobium sp. WBOS01]UUO39454.1 hypothetical protein DCM75_00880 [Bradyrhizobium sp. WBOS02]UUO51685.1 hypothetical protein DCM79_00880 [Bradyrhizobium sp. WBOS07]UUO63921.1 hypothetical protein DCM83_00880 [Bradyrhizobium betae]
MIAAAAGCKQEECRNLSREADRCNERGALPLPQAGEGWGEGVAAMGQSPRGESPHPRLRRDLSRQRER